MHKLFLEKENISDDSYLIGFINKRHGERVHSGEVLFTVETSKSTIDIIAPEDGIISHYLNEQDIVPVGQLVAIIDDDAHGIEDFATTPKADTTYVVQPISTAIPEGLKPRFTDAALTMIKERDIDPAVFGNLSLVKTADVERFLAANAGIQATAVSASTSTQAKEIVILGGNGHARTCIDLIRAMKGYKIRGIVDKELIPGTEMMGIKVIGDDSMLETLYAEGVQFAANGIGTATGTALRGRIYAKAKQIGYRFPNLIHPSAVIEPSASMGEGNQIMMGALVGSCVRIGSNCIVNSGAIVSHDCTIEDNVHLAPGAILAGTVRVGAETIIGMGSTVFFQVTIGSHVTINNGKNIFMNILDGERVK